MTFSGFIELQGLPESQHGDPPFRLVDFATNPPVRTVATALRAAWHTTPPEDAAAVFDDHPGDDQATVRAARSEAMWHFIRWHAQADERERGAVPRAAESQDLTTPWRTTVCSTWRHVFFDAAGFTWECNARAGHWHDQETFAALHATYDAQERQNVDTLVLRHGENLDRAPTRVFTHNVLICPAYFGPGIRIRLERLPLNDKVVIEDEEANMTHPPGHPLRSVHTYVLHDSKDLHTFTNETGTVIWWIRRGVPVRFHVEPLEDREKSDGDLAAVMVYGNLCMVCDLDAERQQNEEYDQNEAHDQDGEHEQDNEDGVADNRE